MLAFFSDLLQLQNREMMGKLQASSCNRLLSLQRTWKICTPLLHHSSVHNTWALFMVYDMFTFPYFLFTVARCSCSNSKSFFPTFVH